MARTKRKEAWEASPEGERAVRFLNNLRLVDDYGGQPLELRPWQERIIRQLFGTVRKDGTRQYNKCFLALPRKQAKTYLCACIVLYLLMGTGKQGQEVYSAAGSRDQAARLFDYATKIIRQDPYLDERCHILTQSKVIKYLPSNNVYQALSADAGLKHGLSPSAIVADELHVWKGRELWDALTSGFGARKERLTIAITTAGFDRNSLCWEEWQYALDVRDGRRKNPRYLPVIYAADPADDWTQEATWRKAMPALGDFCDLDFIREECDQALELPSRENSFRQLYLNQWTEQATRWIPVHKWEACREDYTEDDLVGRDCYGGLDLSATGDLTAFVLAFPFEDGTVRVVPKLFIPRARAEVKERRDRVPYLAWARKGSLEMTPGDAVDYDRVRAVINECGRRFNLRKITADPYNAEQMGQLLRDRDGFAFEYLGQGIAPMNEPSKYLEWLVTTGKVRHDGNPAMTWMMGNVTLQQDGNGNIRPWKKKSIDRIDGVVALVMALCDVMTHDGEPPDMRVVQV